MKGDNRSSSPLRRGACKHLDPIVRKSSSNLPPLALGGLKLAGRRSLSARARAMKLTESSISSSSSSPSSSRKNAAPGSLSEGKLHLDDHNRHSVRLTFAIPSIVHPEPKLTVDDLLRAQKHSFVMNRDTAEELYTFARKYLARSFPNGHESFRASSGAHNVFIQSSQGKYIREERRKLTMCPIPTDRILFILGKEPPPDSRQRHPKAAAFHKLSSSSSSASNATNPLLPGPISAEASTSYTSRFRGVIGGGTPRRSRPRNSKSKQEAAAAAAAAAAGDRR